MDTSMRATLKQTIDKIDSDGYAIVRSHVLAELIAQVAQELEPCFGDRDASTGVFWGKHTTRIEAVLAKSQASHQLVLDPLMLALAEHYLQPYCDRIQLNLTQGIRIHPGEASQVPHRDSSMYPIEKDFDFMVNVIWPLSTFTEDNGATFIEPGSHKTRGDIRLPRKKHLVHAVMEPGDVLFYRSSVVHGGGANRSQLDRTGLAVSYSLGWLRQSENMYLTYPPPVAKTFPEALQRLIGYHVHKPNLGWVFGQDPIHLLSDAPASVRRAEEFISPAQAAMMKGYQLVNSLLKRARPQARTRKE